ncbi:MAG: FAD-binding oxidoreductase [Pseudarcicella sp.]|nr:FAD-binding oxidoreductase [Pseudarcicella sp.]MBP6410729.1 FAD-binding oxidoreductase [Pseudarcicella sp.]
MNNTIYKHYTIVGKGLAGNLLAYFLLKNKQAVTLIHKPTLPNSSQVAAGIYNPVTGRRMVETWLADEIFPFLTDTYIQLEKDFQDAGITEKFFHPTLIFYPFPDEKIKEILTKKFTQTPSKYINLTTKDDYNFIKKNHGGLTISSSGWLDINQLIHNFDQYFRLQNITIIDTEKYDYTNINPQNINNNFTIFCEGYYTTQNPFFSWLPFKPVKGEILNIKLNQETQNINHIINQGFFILPQKDENFRLGATYDWDNLNWKNTNEANKILLEKAEKTFSFSIETLNQQAGIRPATADRRPFIGMHPKHKEIGIFNGFGSKGVSLIPYFANQFSEMLIFNKELHSEVNITRFDSLYLGEF